MMVVGRSNWHGVGRISRTLMQLVCMVQLYFGDQPRAALRVGTADCEAVRCLPPCFSKELSKLLVYAVASHHRMNTMALVWVTLGGLWWWH